MRGTVFMSLDKTHLLAVMCCGCCMRFGLHLDMLKLINRNFVSRRVSTELHAYNVTASVIYDQCKQDAQLSQRDRAAVCVIVFAKSKTLELGDNDLRTL